MTGVKLAFAKTPRKGTFRRQLLLAAFRKCGIRRSDFPNKSWTEITHFLKENEAGWDVRVIGYITTPGKRGRGTSILRVVGKRNWNNRYRSVIL